MVERDLGAFAERLHRWFDTAGRQEGVEILPTVRDRRINMLTERLYEETRGDRAFMVCAAQGNEQMDAFVKATGVNLQIMLLTVCTSLSEASLPTIWRAYKLWIHDRAPEDAVLSELGAR